jgi:outer membrane immunogenic protein
MGSASAADLRRPAYQPPPPPVYTWTGLYWGVNVGMPKVDGVVGGFQSGYNYQFGQWILGLETDSRHDTDH